MHFSVSNIAQLFSVQVNPSENKSIERFSIDSRNIVQGSSVAFIAIEGDKYNGHDFVHEAYEKGVRVFIVSKPLVLPGDAVVILVENTLQALQAIAGHYRKSFKGKVIAITGSNGKTIVKEWLYQVLSLHYVVDKSPLSYNSQVGVPLAILGQNPSADFNIIEVGISQPGEMLKHKNMLMPDYGIFTHLGTAHIENFASQEQLLAEKLMLFEGVEKLVAPEGVALEQLKAPVFKFEEGNNKACVAKAMAVFAPKLAKEKYEQELNTLHSIDHRLQLSHGKKGNIIVNDSHSLDYAGLQVAIDFFLSQSSLNHKTIILSAYSSQSETLYEQTAELIRSKGFDKLVFVGGNKFLQKYFSVLPTCVFYPSTQVLLEHIEALNLNQTDILVKGARAFGFNKVVSALEKMNHHTYLEINLNALANNIKAFQKVIKPSTKLMAMIKASGYGGGIIETAKVLAYNNVDYLGVAYLQEGIELRQAHISLPIMVMNTTAAQLQSVVQYNLEPSVYSRAYLAELIDFACKQQFTVNIHLKLDTGMNRLGIKENELEHLLVMLKKLPSKVRVKSIYSHLAAADVAKEKAFTQSQIAVFTAMANQIETVLGYKASETPLRHICNTKGIENFPEAHFSMVRLGLGMYGIQSAIAKDTVFSFKTSISKISSIKAGESVSYGRRFVAQHDMTIAVLPVGYADGLPRRLGKTGYKVLINQQYEASIIGDICMDMLVIDISNIPAQEGLWVEVFGKHNSILNLSEALDTIPYEILTHIGPRVRRVYIQE